ncbi:MAG: hypothetical protein PHO23_02830 [Candidatus Pacebacteria bacterium]|nr:hypothetical protein [Candidatus Paceibacterota bacterium]
MKTFKIIILLLLSFIYTINVYAFDNKIFHPNITEVIANVYNYKNNHVLAQEDIDSLKKGSSDEDSPFLRSINHFYDPIYNRT